MRAFTAASKAVRRAYNPDGGKSVQQAWQRFSTSQWSRFAARQCALSADPARPAACR
ncbi:hypothetical protein GCM10010353_09070 [Streptomyces chryseus]|uniref:Uncharacterized protein n=1 Tax=Streptomyces chryseus TaxID=68186 RepID=A0ABQ3E0V6_9ACTN|nr:hypothetical protein GCM10010353_09070 [Streptomyces chryseus]GHB22127.1 hypothetical protein GCM10010346_52240 [Streptomyces chryseus]